MPVWKWDCHLLHARHLWMSICNVMFQLPLQKIMIFFLSISLFLTDIGLLNFSHVWKLPKSQHGIPFVCVFFFFFVLDWFNHLDSNNPMLLSILVQYIIHAISVQSSSYSNSISKYLYYRIYRNNEWNLSQAIGYIQFSHIVTHSSAHA